jgi:antitoxin MazE
VASLKFNAKIQPWGNSLGLRITRPLSQMAHLYKGSKVTVEVVEDGILVKPEPQEPAKPWVLPYTEAELVEGLDPEKAHADELPTLLPAEWGE